MSFYLDSVQVIRIVDLIPPPSTQEEFEDVYIVQVSTFWYIRITSVIITTSDRT